MNTQYFLLDKGWLCVDGHIGTDADIVNAARMSYGNGTRTTREDANLISYLLEHEHGTPFEIPDIRFRIKCPLFVSKQFMRHRIASYNEISARYSKMVNEYYVPNEWRIQAKHNKQSSVASDDAIDNKALSKQYVESCQLAFATYKNMLKQGVAREMARMILPASTYTVFICKLNLRSLLNLVSLRYANNAQYEIRVYAEKMLEIIKEWLPLTYDAFDNHVLKAAKFSRDEMHILRLILSQESAIEYLDGSLAREKPRHFSDGQWQRFIDKLKTTS